MSSTGGRLRHASAPRPAGFELTASRQFTAWLGEQKASLAFTTYQAGPLTATCLSRGQEAVQQDGRERVWRPGSRVLNGLL